MNKNRPSVGQKNSYKYSSSKISKFNRTTKGRHRYKSAIRQPATGIQGFLYTFVGLTDPSTNKSIRQVDLLI